MKRLLKKIIPPSLILFYHQCLAVSAALFYHYPSDKLMVIGVTGTNGKSTVVNLVAKILESAGFKVGLTSTYNFKIGDKEWLNDQKMTMLGRFQLQKYLKRMVKEGCQYAVIETSSEGIKQFRHLGLNYDIAIFTNLTPEHLESHGSFENYKEAKGKLFFHLSQSKKKNIEGKSIKKVAIINADDSYAEYFFSFPADEKYGYSLHRDKINSEIKLVRPEKFSVSKEGSQFTYQDMSFNLKLLGEFNLYNALAALTLGVAQNISLEKIKTALEPVESLPGRLEFIDEGQPFKVLIDYAPEVESMKKLYEVLALLSKKRIIHVLGSCGGGRDKARRPILGEMAGKNAQVVIVTNEDPYDEDPMMIINQVAAGAEKGGKVREKDLFIILDREEAIKFALKQAETGDLVLLTGKGAEQAICLENGRKIPWDERSVVRKILADLK